MSCVGCSGRHAPGAHRSGAATGKSTIRLEGVRLLRTLTIDSYTIEIFVPEKEMCAPVFWLHTFAGEGEKIWEQSGKRCVLMCVTGIDWNRDLSPWKAGKVFDDGEDFGGGAEDYLKCLRGRLVPAAERELSWTVRYRGIAGYSMAGLFAVYAMYHCDLFSYIGTMSGSLWFDGWMDYVLDHRPPGNIRGIYVSLGSREHRTKNERMATVKDCTDVLAKYWKEYTTVKYEMNAGSHFKEPELRTAKGIDWLSGLAAADMERYREKN